jgi:hypothetical protein
MEASSNPYSPQTLADLSALADGSLARERQAEVDSRIAASQELSELYARERTVVELLHEARERDRAPLALRERIEAARPTPRARRTRRAGYAGGLTGALAAAALALALALPGGGPGAPSLAAAAALGALPPQHEWRQQPAGERGTIGKSVGAVYFPDWTAAGGWSASAIRTDRLRGHAATTVFYWHGSTAIAYTILSSPPLAEPATTGTELGGLWLKSLRLRGRTVVTWRERGETCILSSATASPATMERLATIHAPR